ncbi:MAG: helix-turn-helix transcriptional regulator [Aminobacterium sp.]|uniref:helix-turn-helix transcriptional regulator n=1 Tax=Aminobacterium sp. TaxID=1872491 RepID=UPI002B21196B|nr:helix-turn-helix transcriptional regulator [Aminobacterium sp.]MEA4876804.1 helix-turn-helix transcriptional regulator [Aminobacterium sp.]
MLLVRLYREKRGISQGQLAKEIGCSLDTVHRWETGKREPRLSDLQKIASFFNCTIDDLLNPQPTPAGESREVRVG